MSETGFTDDDLRVLLYLYDRPDEGQENWLKNVLHAVFGSNDDDSADVVFALIKRQLVRSNGTLAHVLSLTLAGRRAVEELHARQQDRSHRRRRCRDHLLTWVDQQTEPSGTLRVAVTDFGGELDLMPYSVAEARSAATYLQSNGLIESISVDEESHIAMWITESGWDCVDSGGIGASQAVGAAAPTQALVVNGSSNNIVTIAGDQNTAALGAAGHGTATP